MSTLTYLWNNAWMMPNRDCMIFCREEDGMAFIDSIEVDIETDGPGTAWAVSGARMVEAGFTKEFNPDIKKKAMSGDLLEGAVAWIKATMQKDIETFIRENYVDPSLDYRDAVRSVL